MTFAGDIEEAAQGEEIQAIVIGEFGWGGSDGRDIESKGKVLDWPGVRRLLDYEYDDGYGAPECHAVYAWTPTRVIFVSTYDGSTNVTGVPRNPVDCEPYMPGGG